jgi:hypothetical protein
MAACEACGWAAAFCSALAFGSFGVPIKSKASLSVDIDPLVFQSYKTFMCFITSWLVLFQEDFSYSPWGIVSGLFWVPGGVATIYAVKAAGLAVGIGIGSSFIVLVSFVWGIFIFKERVHSKFAASLAIMCMVFGLLGMSYFSSPSTGLELDCDDDLQLEEDRIRIRSTSSSVEYQGVESTFDDEVVDGETVNSQFDDTDEDESQVIITDRVVMGCKLTKRQLGMLAAVFCGIWGGSILVPMKFVPLDDKGTHYLISFSIGSSIINISLWIIRYLYYVGRYKSFQTAYHQLPSFHVRVMWRSGGLAGLLWSIGNYFSLISVYYLGEGVGYPLVQTSILVAGLWGIFYFKEVPRSKVGKWFASSLLTVLGILMLSYEHHEK